VVATNHRNLFAKVIEGDAYYFVTVNNNSVKHEKIYNQCFDIALDFKKARMVTPEREIELAVENGRVVIPEIHYSFILRLER